MPVSSIPDIRVRTKPTCLDGVTVKCGAFVNRLEKYLMVQDKLFITNDGQFVKLRY